MRIRLVAIIITLIILVPVFSSPAIAQDDWPDQCNKAKSVSTGTFTGKLTPNDIDTFVLERSDGDSVSLNFEINESQITFTVINNRVVNALYTAGTKEEFKKAVNHPKETRHNHNLDYSLSGGFSQYGGSKRWTYHWMGGGSDVYYLLAFNPKKQVVSKSPFFGPIWIGGPGTVETTMFFRTGDPMCLRVQTTDKQKPGSWKLTISNETQTSTSKPTTTSSQSTEQTQQTAASNQGNGGNEQKDTDGDGISNAEDYAPRDPDVQAKSDVQDSSGGSGPLGVAGPGFGSIAAIVALVSITLIARKKS